MIILIILHLIALSMIIQLGKEKGNAIEISQKYSQSINFKRDKRLPYLTTAFIS